MGRKRSLFSRAHTRIKPSAVFATLLLLLFAGCGESQEPARKISLNKTATVAQVPAVDDTKAIRIAIAAIISPKETYISYKGILDYIHTKLQTPVQLVQRDTYAEVNNLIRDGEIDAAFVCTGAYTEGHRDFGMELLVAPVAYGETVYYSYIIVPRDSDVHDLTELRGKSFAFTDPMSNTGKLSPTYILSRMGETPETFFKSFHFTYSHDKSIQAVSSGIVDAASVDSLVWDYLNAKDPTHTAKTRIINRSEPYGIPPVVVPGTIDPELKKKLRDIFLTMHENKEGRRLLSEVMIDRFVEVDDSLYDSVREMEKRVNKP
ncbi:MAG: phosphate/phosphite/phosphonate ABC transporter substrate-binding protein [Proteobacteria bacterium]|nr:phosphate/phosphite/phosphonate ABC transporter substrate-binding protein [Pseudomonadota bacterium]MBU1738998.1 phosphate/phosphite/phosphonate ABC transporter substrate-binding protein [Pseudomonadota bacterium]